MFRATAKALKSAGIVQTHLQFEEALDSGFAFGLWWKYDPRPTDGRDLLASFLSRIDLSFDQLRALPGDRERMAVIADKLAQERPGLQHWFKLGMWVFANDVPFRPLHIRLLGPQAVMLQADAITKLLQQFWGAGRRTRRGSVHGHHRCYRTRCTR